jgi:hypothetical protein
MRLLYSSGVLILLFLVGPSALDSGPPVVFGFEGFSDSTLLTTQIPGLNFSNTIVLTAGITLNEFEFPPHSGSNVASDNGGPITINFSPVVFSFDGYFTYSVPLTVRAFDADNAQITMAVSRFSNNQMLSGDPGSSPNEFLQVNASAGMSAVTITGDPAGQSFAMDDVVLSNQPTSTVPVLSLPNLVALALVLALTGVWAARKQSARARAVYLVFVLLVPLAVVGLWPWAYAQDSAAVPPDAQRLFGTLKASPLRFPAGTPSAVTVRVRVDDSSVIPNSVNLIRFNPTGSPTILGQLRRNANGEYTASIMMNEPSSSRMVIRASAALRGKVRRRFSNALTIVVTERNR